MEVSGQLHTPATLPPGKEPPGTHWIGGWVGPRAVLDAVVKRKIPSPRRESNPRTPIVQPVTQSYTDWAITDLKSYSHSFVIYKPLAENATDLSTRVFLVKMNSVSLVIHRFIPGKKRQHTYSDFREVTCNVRGFSIFTYCSHKWGCEDSSRILLCYDTV
jgi:hypothetical protein